MNTVKYIAKEERQFLKTMWSVSRNEIVIKFLQDRVITRIVLRGPSAYLFVHTHNSILETNSFLSDIVCVRCCLRCCCEEQAICCTYMHCVGINQRYCRHKPVIILGHYQRSVGRQQIVRSSMAWINQLVNKQRRYSRCIRALRA